MNQDFLLYLQQVLKEHNLESSLEELAVVCSRYGIEKPEQLEPDTISGIYHTVLANRQKESKNDSGGNLATLMRQKFKNKVEREAKQIVQDYQNVPLEVQETVIKTMLQQYSQKNPKIDEFLKEADYAKIAEENIQASQKMLQGLLCGLVITLGFIFASSFLDSFARLLATKTIPIQERGVSEYVKN